MPDPGAEPPPSPNPTAPTGGGGRRVALVTGGAKRIGRAIVERLAGAGFEAALTYLNSSAEAEALRAQLRDATGRDPLLIRADLTRPHEAADALDNAVRDRFGRLDVLVNNASIYQPATLADTDLDLIHRVTAIHLQSPLLLCQRFADLLRASRGHVVNMTDLLAERPWPRYLAYSASKAALSSLTLGLARELAPEVTVNAIAPGVVEWPADYPEAEREKYLSRVPLLRPGTPEDVANLVHYLVTEGTYMTGQIIRLDGGRSVT